MRYLSRYDCSYDGIAKHVQRYKTQSHVRIDYNTDAFLGLHGEYNGIRLWSTEIVRFYPDGTIQLSNGGWATYSTKDRINKYTPEPVHVYTQRGKWYLRDVDGEVGKDRVWKCRTCHGKNKSLLPEVIEQHNDTTKLAFMALAQEQPYAPHEWDYQKCRAITKYNFDTRTYDILEKGCGYDTDHHLHHCYRCNDTSIVNYGAKRKDIDFENGMKIRIDNEKVVVVD